MDRVNLKEKTLQSYLDGKFEEPEISVRLSSVADLVSKELWINMND